MKTPTFILILFTGFLFIQCQNQTSPEISQSSMLASLDQRKPDNTLTAEQVDVDLRDPCARCKSQINSESAGIMIYEKCDFISKLNSLINCRNSIDKHLVGIYIKPYKITGQSKYGLRFIPAFSNPLMFGSRISCPPNFVEDTCVGHNFPRIVQEASSLSSPQFSGVIAVGSNYANQSGYISSDFQFCNAAYVDSAPCTIVMSNSFVGFHDLMQILSHSETEFIGISGARISTGNLNLQDVGGIMRYGNNEDYFTLKFTGFRELEFRYTRELPGDKLYLVRVNTKSSGVNLGYDIPAEHFAVPCPPRWTPI